MTGIDRSRLAVPFVYPTGGAGVAGHAERIPSLDRHDSRGGELDSRSSSRAEQATWFGRSLPLRAVGAPAAISALMILAAGTSLLGADESPADAYPTRYTQSGGIDFSDLEPPTEAEKQASAADGAASPSTPPAAAPSGGTSSAGSSSGDENSEIAPEEVISIPEPDNTELLQRLGGGEEQIDRYEDESMKARVQVKKEGDQAVRHGAYVEFYRGGGKFCEGVYENGKRTGAWRYWYDDGKLAKLGAYKDDRAVGTWYYLRNDQSLERVEEYAEGLQSGRWLHLGPDGKTVFEIRRFEAGRPHGKWHAWYTPTRKRFEYEFANGLQNGVAKAWYSDGKKWFEGAYVQGERDGAWVWWDRSGREIKRNEWKAGERVAGQ